MSALSSHLGSVLQKALRSPLLPDSGQTVSVIPSVRGVVDEIPEGPPSWGRPEICTEREKVYQGSPDCFQFEDVEADDC